MREWTLLAAPAIALASAPAAADVRPLIDLRLRYEGVDQTGLPKDADALTMRARAGFDAGLLPDIRLLVEAEGTLALVERYDSTTNGQTRFPIVADPETVEINRLQLTTRLLPKTQLTLGRQRINLDDQRLVGNVGWRDNEQTFDAVRVEATPMKAAKLDFVYAWSDRTVFGIDSPIYSIGGDNVFANASYLLPFATLTAFGYWIDQDHPSRRQFSSRTLGARLAGKQAIGGQASLTYALSYARQADAYDNPRDYAADYWLADAALSAGALTVGAGYEVLGADDGRPFSAFQTPLATLHKFQGWVDKFLVTPPDGIHDLYASAGYGWKGVGPFDSLGVNAVYHDFRSDRADQHYGNEINLMLLAKAGRLSFTTKYADYDARRFATDTRKLWFAVDYSY